jgi:hypothetical protein
MNNFEKETIELIESLSLNPNQLNKLIEAFEWEKEMSWSNGYADAVDHYEYGIVNLVGEA